MNLPAVGKQEPGSEADIKSFCSTKYSVTFPMFSKVWNSDHFFCMSTNTPFLNGRRLM